MAEHNEKFATNKDGDLVNEYIRFPEVLLIDENGESLGIKSRVEALAIAKGRGLDLLCVAPGAKPAVCKIVNYGKYRFEQQKKAKEAKKNMKVMDVKEVRLSLNIDVGDFNTKANHARRFLSDGNKVKVSIRFRGREMAHAENGNVIMDRFAEACAEVGTVEKPAKLEGRSMLMFLVPKTTK